MLFKVLITVAALSVLIIIHEGGHYLAARAFGMRVLKYSIGFGPTLFRYQPKGSPTVFQVAVIPFLAYVQIAGMNPNEDVDPNDPELYPNKSLFARFVTIAAGPVANYLTASLIVFGLGEHIGGQVFGIGGLIGDNENFAGAGDHVDAHRTSHDLLGQSNINIARSGDNVHLGNRLRAVCQSGDGPGASNLVNFFNTNRFSRRQ